MTTQEVSRKKKIIEFLKSKKDWIYGIALSIVVWFGALYIRTLNISNLKNVTTGNWTLAPDLDPFLFLRWAKYIVENGSLMAIDHMRYVPLGFETAREMPFVSYGIAYLYKIMSLFSNVTVEYAAIWFPVIMFLFTLIAFFFFVKQLFIKQKNAKLIALISTAFLAVIPGFLHRTIAGVPEKESAAFLFMFLSFYFILKAWNSEKNAKSYLFGALAGISTGIMGLTWGGVSFVFITLSLAAIVSFFMCDFKKKDMISFMLWALTFTLFLYPFPRFGSSLFNSTTSLSAYFVSILFFKGFLSIL